MLCSICHKEILNLGDHKKCSEQPKGGIITTDKLPTIGRDTPETIIPLKDMTVNINFSEIMENFPGIMTYNRKSVKGRIIDLLNKQTDKGLQKYGHTLDDCPDNKFDWRLMVIEELVDALQYQQKEIQRLEKLNVSLKSEIEHLDGLLMPDDSEPNS